MANMIDIPGTDNKVDPTDPVGAAKTLVMTILGFAIAAMTAAVGVKLWNRIAQNTPDQLQTVDLI
jgi:hypothetical protein